MKISPLLLLGTVALVGCDAPTLEDARTNLRLMVMGGNLEKAPLVNPQGGEPTAPEALTGEPSPVPAPAAPAFVEKTPMKRDVATARAFVFESKWHSIPIWLYPDGVYATGEPQRLRGSWKESHRVLTLDPDHGGRLIFGPDASGNYLPEDAGTMRMRKVQP